MQIKNELAKIVGKDHVSDAREECAKYSKDYSLLPSGMPDVVVWPAKLTGSGKSCGVV